MLVFADIEHTTTFFTLYSTAALNKLLTCSQLSRGLAGIDLAALRAAWSKSSDVTQRAFVMHMAGVPEQHWPEEATTLTSKWAGTGRIDD